MVTPLRKRSDGIQTMALVKKFARAELDKYGAVKFNLDRVLEKSGVCRGALCTTTSAAAMVSSPLWRSTVASKTL